MGQRPGVTSDLRVARWLGACFALLYLAFGHGHFTTTDEVGPFLTTESLWRDADLRIANLPPHVFEGRDGHHYSIFAVGQSVLALPFFALGEVADRWVPRRWTRLVTGRNDEGFADTQESPQIFAVTLYGPAASGLLIGIFYLFERRLGAGRRAALLASALLGASTYVAHLSAYFLRHTTEAIAIVGSLYATARFRDSGRARDLAASSLLASFTLLIRVPAAIAGPGLAAYLVHALRTRARGAGEAVPRLRWIVAVLAPAGSVAVAHMGINQMKWGAWIASPMLAQGSKFITPLSVGVPGLLVSPGNSLFVYSPLLLLLPWTLPPFWRRHRAECGAILAISLCLLLLAAPFEHWHGLWSAPGPRMIFAAVPLLMLPLGPWLEGGRSRLALLATGGLALLGAAIQLVLLSARWRGVVESMGYEEYPPPERFLFEPTLSPVIGCLRGLLAGDLDLWLVSLWTGVPGREAAPEVALGAMVIWGLMLALCGIRLRAALRAPTGV
jgi:hypothetical protein